jgi:hypothetical protein
MFATLPSLFSVLTFETRMTAPEDGDVDPEQAQINAAAVPPRSLRARFTEFASGAPERRIGIVIAGSGQSRQIFNESN